MRVDWVFLIMAGLLEMTWTYAMKQSAGFTRVIPSTMVLITGGLSLYLLSLAMRSIPLGIAYAVWTGIGAAGTLVVGMILLGETISLLRGVAVALILSGLVAMRLSAD